MVNAAPESSSGTCSELRYVNETIRMRPVAWPAEEFLKLNFGTGG